MARRKRKEESFEWTPPEFDEVGYMRQEIAGAKAAVLTIAWAGAGAIVSYFLYSITWVLAFFAGLFVFAGLRYVMPILGVRTTGFKRKDWAGHAVTYFFSWLAFWILLLNVPAADITAPTLNNFFAGSFSSAIGPEAGNVTCVAPTGSTIRLQTAGNDTLYLSFRATDNVGIAGLTVKVNTAAFIPEDVSGQRNVCRGHPQAFFPDGTYVVRTLIQATTRFTVDVVASDAAGHTTAASFTVQVA